MTANLPSLAWIFDDSPIPDPHNKGEAAVKFIRALKHPKSTLPGGAFDLSRWQERIVRRVYGDTLPDGSRRINELFLMVGRGNRKTSLMAACLMLHLVGPERRNDTSIASFANSREQSALTFKEMAGICRATPRVMEAVHIQDARKTITYRKRAIVYEALSSDAKGAHGRNDVAAFWDEGHAETKTELLEAVETGLNKADNTLLLSASTAGVGRTGPFWAKYEQAHKIVDGRIEDETFLPVLFEAPADVDWRSDDWLFATNPGLSCSPAYPNLKKLKRYREKCEHSPSERESYKRLHLSVYLDGAAEPAWDMGIWDQNAEPAVLDELEGSRAWIAIDLSKQTDLSAVAIAIERPDNRVALHVQSFAPEEGIRRRAGVDAAPYPLWRDQGFLTACPGDVVDRGMIEAYVRDLCERFDVAEINFDRWSAREMMESLDRDGLPVVEFPQTIGTYTPAINAFELAMFERRLEHGGNPLLRWAVSNVVLYSDASGNRRPDKKRAPDRIDPAAAAIMAAGRALAGNTKRSAYDVLDVEDLNF